MTDTPFELFKPSRRSQRANSGRCSNIQNKYDIYLKKLQEKNKLLQSKDESLKQREDGFQLYINGAHSLPPRRPPSVSYKRPENSFNRTQTPAPVFSNFKKANLSKNATRRRRWSLTTQTKIKTEEGSIIADIDSPKSPSDFPINKQITYRLNVDQSWMPDWCSQVKPHDFKQSLSNYSIKSLALSLDDIPTTIRLTKSEQETYRLPTMVGR